MGRAAYQLGGVKILAGAGVVRPIRPDKLARIGNALRRWGRSPAAGFITGAIRNPDSPAVIDELGTLTFSEIDERTNALAAGLADAGVKEGDGVAIMCRNHRGFVEATVANAKLGANSLYLNTAFAGPQITEVVKREKPVAIVFDQEFTDLLEDAGTRRKRFVGWVDDPDTVEDPTLEGLIQDGSDRPAGAAGEHRQDDHPDLGHHGHAEGGQPRARPTRSTRPRRSCRGSRWSTGPRRTSRRRCSTRGASPTSTSACCWAPRWC